MANKLLEEVIIIPHKEKREKRTRKKLTADSQIHDLIFGIRRARS